jgi:hypothetical protein
MAKRQRPATARAAADGMKLHRRVLRLDGRDHTVIGLRPGSTARFSTNRFHQTWHVLSDQHGARLLARLLWGLSYQARPDTVLLIDRPFLTPTPFDADPADPIMLIPGWNTMFGERATRDLKARLPLSTPSHGTVRWRTFGLDQVLADLETWRRDSVWQPERGKMERRCGVVFLRPYSPEEARRWAVQAATMDPNDRYGTDYDHFGSWDRNNEGEIQIFRDFGRRVSVARRARTDVLAGQNAPDDPESLREAVWARGDVISGEAVLRVRDGGGLGAHAAKWLAVAGVHTLDDLAAAGPAVVFRRLRDAELPGLSLAMLWAMEGALTYRDRREVGAYRKAQLLAEVDAAHPA